MRKLLTVLLLCLAMLTRAQYKSEMWPPDNEDGTYANAIINADYSDSDVVAVGDTYYLTTSSFNCMPGLLILASKDLVNWTIIGHALQRQFPDSITPQHGEGMWNRGENGLHLRAT